MDHFVVSARKYRPSTFNTVIGQSAITGTLKNAIKTKHLAQAFLFCGPRGVGKTTCARILAKTINCTNLDNDTESCNGCESCVSFNNGQSLNIFELDAASNNSVDDMRNLVDQVRYAPQTGNYKIYIIDEVHMLSASAFNAFLKTLEEPPAYAIFILATTEKHKIIPTILSRCQIFDFNRITIDDIAKHLQWIAEKEKVSAESEALHLIAQKADGALRDALSIFDQIVSFAGSEVTYKHVIDNLNILDYEYYFKITDYLLAGDFSQVLLLLNEIIEEGFDVHHFITGLSAHFRDLLVSLEPQTIQLLEVSGKTKDRYKAQSQQCSASLLYRFLETGNRCDIDFKSSKNQRLHVELALLKLCSFNQNAFKESSEILSAGQLSEKKKEPVESVKPSVVISKSVKSNPKPDEFISEPPLIKKAASRVTKVIAPENAIKESQQPVINKTRTGAGSTISIKKKLQGNKLESNDSSTPPPANNHQDIPVNVAALGPVFKLLVEKLQSEGRKQLAVALNMHEPILLDNKIIEIAVDNPIQAEEIQNNKQELLGYFRKQLLNFSVEINTRVAEDHEQTDTAYTPAEKFSKMAEKNPDLNQLRQQFDLELDF